MLARWLRAKLGTAGAASMVQQYGARRILDALYDGIVSSTPEQYLDERSYDRSAATDDHPSLRQHIRQRYVLTINPALRSPGGFLRRQLERQEQAP